MPKMDPFFNKSTSKSFRKSDKQLEKESKAYQKQIMETNVKGPVRMVASLLPLMVEAQNQELSETQSNKMKMIININNDSSEPKDLLNTNEAQSQKKELQEKALMACYVLFKQAPQIAQYVYVEDLKK